MKQLLFAGVVSLLAINPAARCDSPKGKTDETKALHGTWVATAAVMSGQEFPEAIVKSIRLVLTDGKYSVMVGAQPDQGTWKHDPTKKPKQLSITGTEGPNKGKTFLAIYELKGDTLRVCYDLSGKAYPEEFKSKPQTQLFLATYEREKQKP